MTTKTTTISMEEDQLAVARRAADEAGLSFSAYIARCEQDARQRANGRRYRDYLSSLDGADRAMSDGWDTMADNRILFTEDAA